MTDDVSHTIGLGASMAQVLVSAGGVRLADLHLPTGASVGMRQPGRLRGRRPARTLDLGIDDTSSGAYVRWDLRVRPQDDGAWQVSVSEQWAVQPDLVVATPAGGVRVTQSGGGIDAQPEHVAPGWGVRTQHEDGDVRVTLTGDGEVWEVLAMTDDAGEWPFVVAREHRRVIDGVPPPPA